MNPYDTWKKYWENMYYFSVEEKQAHDCDGFDCETNPISEVFFDNLKIDSTEEKKKMVIRCMVKAILNGEYKSKIYPCINDKRNFCVYDMEEGSNERLYYPLVADPNKFDYHQYWKDNNLEFTSLVLCMGFHGQGIYDSLFGWDEAPQFFVKAWKKAYKIAQKGAKKC